MTASTAWTDWSCLVRLTVADESALELARDRLVALMTDIARSANRFDPDSDISRINLHAGHMVSVDTRTLAVVDAALDAAAETGGAVDPTIGLHVARSGYIHDIEKIRGQLISDVPPTAEVTPCQADWTRVQINHALGQVGVPAGMALDLGATAKPFAADLAVVELSTSLGTPVLVEIGGDVSVSDQLDDGWEVDVSETGQGPHQQVTIGRGGIATSSTTAQRWRTHAGEQHHIIDPRTGLPAVGPWRTVTVWSDTALEANSASTAAIVLGDEAESYLDELDLAARLVSRDGEIVTTGNWPTERRAA